MSRTEELRQQGATERGGGGGGAPFVKWGDDYAYVEGHVTDHFESKYGDAVTLKVTAASPGLQAAGKDEDGKPYRVSVAESEEVNVGLNSTALEGAITKEDRGGHFHVAFEGWQESKKTGQRYRVFAVLEIEPREVSDPADPGNEQAGVGVGPGAPGAEQPPIDESDPPF